MQLAWCLDPVSVRRRSQIPQKESEGGAFPKVGLGVALNPGVSGSCTRGLSEAGGGPLAGRLMSETPSLSQGRASHF